MQKAVQAYFETQVTTTSQGALLLMLYDGAIKFLVMSKEKIRERDYAAKGILLSKAIDVISELDASLNPQKGGDLADNLHKLYFYCNTRLLNANLKLDVTYVDEVIKILSGLREAYRQIIQTNAAPASQTPVPAAGQGDPPATPEPSPIAAQPQNQPKTQQPQAKTIPLPVPGKKTAPPAAKASTPTTPGPVQTQGKTTPLPTPAKTAATTPPVATENPAAPPRPQLVHPMATRNAAYQTAAATGEPQTESKNAAPPVKPQTKPAPPAAPASAPQKQTPAEPKGDSRTEPVAPASLQGKRLAGAAVYRKMSTDP